MLDIWLDSRKMKNLLTQKQKMIGLGILGLGLVLFFGFIPAGVDRPNEIAHATLSPAFWPRLIAMALALMGVLLFLSSAHGEEKSADAASEGLPETLPWTRQLAHLGIVLGALFGFYFVVPVLGMVLPAVVLIFGLMWFAQERRLRLMLTISLLTPLLLYFFFVTVAKIPIPLGLFEALRG